MKHNLPHVVVVVLVFVVTAAAAGPISVSVWCLSLRSIGNEQQNWASYYLMYQFLV
jgi:hypothetical protein